MQLNSLNKYRTAQPQLLSGFTLVELLVVIGIIGLLLQMLLPAVEMSRESARKTQCANNLRQLALAAQAHVTAHGHFPTGGWTTKWVGDCNRGFREKQPGGWAFNLLPYLEQESLYSMAWGLDASHDLEPKIPRGIALHDMLQVPLKVYICPSRRLAKTYPLVTEEVWLGYFVNAYHPEKVARGDYAANMGNLKPNDQNFRGPLTYEEADLWKVGTDNKKEWTATHHNGLVHQRSAVKPGQVTDGLSNTYLFGEKFMKPADYKTGIWYGDDQALYVGFSRDYARTAHSDHPPIKDKFVPNAWLAGADDTHEVTSWNFGSAHPESFQMALADGSLRKISYDIDMKIFGDFSTRAGNSHSE